MRRCARDCEIDNKKKRQRDTYTKSYERIIKRNDVNIKVRKKIRLKSIIGKGSCLLKNKVESSIYNFAGFELCFTCIKLIRRKTLHTHVAHCFILLTSFILNRCKTAYMSAYPKQYTYTVNKRRMAF